MDAVCRLDRIVASAAKSYIFSLDVRGNLKLSLMVRFDWSLLTFLLIQGPILLDFTRFMNHNM